MAFPDQDWLTGLRLKPHLQEQFLQIVSQSDAQLALIYIDIDGFVFFNDEYGFMEGDKFLQQIVQVISLSSLPKSELFRVGGDKFVMLFTGISMPVLMSIAEEIRQRVETQFADMRVRRRPYKPDNYGSPTVSCAIALYPEHGTDLDSLLRSADNTMYEESKKLGGNRVVLAKPEF